MTFQELQNLLREACSARIQERRTSGLSLANSAGFRQSHFSNFLNHHRGLSLAAMDRLLTVLSADVLDIIPTSELHRHLGASANEEFDNVPCISPHDLAVPQPTLRGDSLKLQRPFLCSLRTSLVSRRSAWLRFVCIQADANDTDMFPRIVPGSLLLIDRHYNSLRPYRRGEPNIYAVRRGSQTLLRYAEIHKRQLILRPHSNLAPLEFLQLGRKHSLSTVVLGRVCLMQSEL